MGEYVVDMEADDELGPYVLGSNKDVVGFEMSNELFDTSKEACELYPSGFNAKLSDDKLYELYELFPYTEKNKKKQVSHAFLMLNKPNGLTIFPL